MSLVTVFALLRSGGLVSTLPTLMSQITALVTKSLGERYGLKLAIGEE